MRRLTLIAAALALAACASPGTPPGGPEDHAPPKLLSVSPDTNTRNQHASAVTFRFDEVVSERPGSAQSLDKLVLLSPSDGAPRVRWRRSAIQIRPRKSFRPNTTYSVTILPGIADLRGNTQTSPFTTFFSTGAEVSRTHLAGVVFDWVTAKPVPRAFVQMFQRGDTTFSWIAQADSAGRFAITSFPSGSYLIRALSDANDNRGLDPRELWDTVGVAVADSARVEMYAFVHDTIGPRIDRVNVADSVTLGLDFDKGVDPSSPLTAAQFVIFAPDSTPLSVLSLPSDSIVENERAARARARGDTTRAGTDSARADSARAVRAAPRAPTDSRVPLPQPARGRVAARVDTMPLPVPTRKSPITRLNLRLAAPLKPSTTYRLRATGIRGLLGNARSSDKLFTTPKPPAPPDTTKRVNADSVRRSVTPGDSVRRAPRTQSDSLRRVAPQPASTPPRPR